MANELSITLGLSYLKATARAAISTGAQLVSVSGTPFVHEIEAVGTTDEALDLGDVSAPGFVVVHNLDATNYIEFGPDSTNYFTRLKAGEWSIFRMTGSALHAKANTASCNLEYYVFSN